MNKKLTALSGNVTVYPLNYVTGTYSQTGTTLTITVGGGHSLVPGEDFYVYYSSFTTGTPIQSSIVVSGGYAIVNPTTLTITLGSAATRTGNLLLTRLVSGKTGTYTVNSTGVITINVASHGYQTKDYVFAKFTSGGMVSMPALIESLSGGNAFKIVGKTDPGLFYSNFGVYNYHSQGIYGKGVRVYVIDEGFNDIDLSAPGLQAISDLANFTVRNISTEGSGSGGLSHGGLTCALLGASNDNGAGIVGICPDSTLFMADVDDSAGDIFLSSVGLAIDDAIASGADILSISLGSTYSSPALQSAINRALDAGILIFVSAGNSESIIYEYPASYPGVISVASVDINRNKSSFNTQNDRISLFAPGENYPLPSPKDEADIVYMDGTSFSCPFAAGLAALVLQKQWGLVNNTYSGNGTTATFNYTQKIDSASELRVVIRNNISGAETVKRPGEHFEITGVGNISGGNITFTAGNIPSASETVFITKRISQTSMVNTLKDASHLNNLPPFQYYTEIPSTESTIEVSSGLGVALAVLAVFAVVIVAVLMFKKK